MVVPPKYNAFQTSQQPYALNYSPPNRLGLLAYRHIFLYILVSSL